MPLAADPHFRPVPPTSPAPEPFFLFVATLEPRKNVEGLIDAWRESRSETHADLVIAGRSRADFHEIPSAEGLHFLGEVPDQQLPRLYSDALAFVYPTHYEGFGLPVLEAMQCGCPVVTSRDPAVMEVSGGAAIHAGDTQEIAEAMRAWLRTPGCATCCAAAVSSARGASPGSARRALTHEIYEEAARPHMKVVMLRPNRRILCTAGVPIALRLCSIASRDWPQSI